MQMVFCLHYRLLSPLQNISYSSLHPLSLEPSCSLPPLSLCFPNSPSNTPSRARSQCWAPVLPSPNTGSSVVQTSCHLSLSEPLLLWWLLRSSQSPAVVTPFHDGLIYFATCLLSAYVYTDNYILKPRTSFLFPAVATALIAISAHMRQSTNSSEERNKWMNS